MRQPVLCSHGHTFCGWHASARPPAVLGALRQNHYQCARARVALEPKTIHLITICISQPECARNEHTSSFGPRGASWNAGLFSIYRCDCRTRGVSHAYHDDIHRSPDRHTIEHRSPVGIWVRTSRSCILGASTSSVLPLDQRCANAKRSLTPFYTQWCLCPLR